jgi:DtxR family Mn-dependent transcriptional regulator
MANHNLDNSSTSESIEMYLLRVALLQKSKEPVPIPMLAQELSVSPVSANEMCRKLTERALITYEPYKGVTLTTKGEKLAGRVLRCRRLWEVFFVQKLSIEPEEAEEMACRFEHVTPDELADRLAVFLENPTLSPQNEPIPAANDMPSDRLGQPLTTLAAGEQGQIVNINADDRTKEFLHHQGIYPGARATVLAVAPDGALLLDVSGQRLSLCQEIARDVEISMNSGG